MDQLYLDIDAVLPRLREVCRGLPEGQVLCWKRTSAVCELNWLTGISCSGALLALSKLLSHPVAVAVVWTLALVCIGGLIFIRRRLWRRDPALLYSHEVHASFSRHCQSACLIIREGRNWWEYRRDADGCPTLRKVWP